MIERNHTADTLKAALILLVIVGHVFTEGVHDNEAKRAIYLFHMPIFLGWSGYFFSQKIRAMKDLWERALPRYLIPWLMTSVFFLVFLYAIKGRLQFTLVNAFLNPWFHLWYVPCLFAFSAIFTKRRRVPILVVTALFMVPILMRAVGINPMILIGDIDGRYVFYGIYFAIGVAVRRYESNIPSWVGVALLFGCTVAAVSTFEMHLRSPELDFLRVALVTGAIVTMAKFPNLKTPLGSSIFSRENLGIYLYHFAAILLVREIVDDRGLWYWTAALFASCVLIPALIHVIRLTPFGEMILGTLPSADRRGGAMARAEYA